MTGGLIQLITTGAQDAVLIGNPEITFFKKTYRRHTPFSLCENNRYVGKLPFNKKGTTKIDKNGDLLQGQYFKLEIPYFEIIKTLKSSGIIDNGYNINSLDVTYMNTNCYVVYVDNNWFVIPEILFTLSSFDYIISELDAIKLQPNLLPEYIDTSDLAYNVYFYQISNSPIGLTNIMRVNSSFWEQFWLYIVSNTNDQSIIISLKNYYNNLNITLQNRIYNQYNEYNFLAINSEYFKFEYPLTISGEIVTNNIGQQTIESETQRYYNYIDMDVLNYDQTFDMDVVYRYCINNKLNFDDYKNNAIQYNSLIISMMFNMLFSDNYFNFSFWKSYSVFSDEGNRINPNINNTITHNQNEWANNFNNMVAGYDNIPNKNLILDNLRYIYSECETRINGLYNNMNFTDPTTIYSKLKTILQRFITIPNKQISYNMNYLATHYTDIDPVQQYNDDNYDYMVEKEKNNYMNLNSMKSTLDASNEMHNLTPVNLENIFAVIANELLDFETASNNMTRAMQSFITLWKNIVTIRLYQKHLDFYTSSLVNSINSSDNLNRKVNYYQVLSPSNIFSYQDLKNSFYSMFYKNSFIGSISVDNNNFQNLIQNINLVQIKNLNTDFSDVTNKQFNKLVITNTYNYHYIETIERYDNYGMLNEQTVYYDASNMELQLKYDNFYDMNSIMTLNINNILIPTTTNSFYYKIITSNLGDNLLVLCIKNCPQIQNGDNIQIIVKYTNYLPIVTMYNEGIQYNNLTINHYYLLEKFTNNDIKTINFVDNTIYIDSTLYNSPNIKLLTINYMDMNKIIPPSNTFILTRNNVTNSYLAAGVYGYAISFLTADGESEVSKINSITLDTDGIVEITNIPTSQNYKVICRKIYRTVVNSNTLYLLYTINDNTTTTFIDNINDMMLGNIVLPKSNMVTQKRIVRIINKNGYYLTDMMGRIIMLPKTFDNILNMYIEEVDASYGIIQGAYSDRRRRGNDFISEFTNYYIPLNQPAVHLINQSDFSPDYLYYLINNENLMDNIPLIPTKSYQSIYLPQFSPSINMNSMLQPGTYIYKIAYCNSITEDESLPTDTITLTLTDPLYSIVMTDFPNIYDSRYNGWAIYRSDDMGNTFNLVKVLERTVDNMWEDVGTGTIRPYVDPYFIISKPINTALLSRSNTYVIELRPTKITSGTTKGLTGGTYNYCQTFTTLMDDIPGWFSEESFPSSIYSITIPSDNDTGLGYSVNVSCPISTDSRVQGIKIYRTLANNVIDFYLMGEIANVTTESMNPYNMYTDSMNDMDLKPNKNPLLGTNTKGYVDNMMKIYSILKVPIKNVAPNLNQFLSHSTDINFMNEKDISDMNDYLINKPFIAMVSSTDQSNNIELRYNSSYDLINSFSKSYAYFHNINFNINETSIITINDVSVNYIIPISTQQFYIKDPSDVYFSINFDYNTVEPVSEMQIIQETFNPAYDPFNVLPSYIIRPSRYPNNMIQSMIDKLEIIVNLNNDYLMATTTIDSTYSIYTNSFTELMIPSNIKMYGLTSAYIYNAVNNVNLVMLNGTTTIYSLMNTDISGIIYNNSDFLNCSHDTPRLIEDGGSPPDSQLVNFIKPLETIRILDPVYMYYNSTNKFSYNLATYFLDVSRFFTSHILYVTNNSDYISISNPDNYKQQFISYQEIKQDVQDNYYDYAGTNNITTLQPILDQSYNMFSKIIITDEDGSKNIITNFTIQSNNNFTTSQYRENKLQNNYSNNNMMISNIKDYNENKFNYLGMVAIDSSSNFQYNDMYIADSTSTTLYFKLDNVYVELDPSINIGRYRATLPISDRIVSNPLLLDMTNSPAIQYHFYKMPSKYYYEISLQFITLPDDIPQTIQFLLNNTIITANYNNMILSFIVDTPIVFDCTSLTYQSIEGNYSEWVVSPQITGYVVKDFRELNFSYNSDVSGIIPDFSSDLILYYTDNLGRFNLYSAANMIFLDGIYYTYIPPYYGFDVVPLFVLYYVNYIVYPPMVLSNNIVYDIYYQSQSLTMMLKTTPMDNMILMIDMANRRYFMNSIGMVSTNQIPNSNYNIWLYPKSQLNTVEYNVDITIDESGNISGMSNTNIPTYSFYVIEYNGMQTIYYYESGDSIIVSDDISYYNVRNVILDKIYLINGNMFKTDMKQMLGLYKEYNMIENFVTKQLTIMDNMDNLETFDSFDMLSYKSQYIASQYSVISYNDNNFNILGDNEVVISLIITNPINNNIIYQPIIVKNYENFTIPNIIFMSDSGDQYKKSFIPINSTSLFDASNNLITDKYIGTIDGTDNFISMNPYIDVSNNQVYIKRGFHVYNINFGLYLWKLKTTDQYDNIYYMYFWTLFTQDENLINDYLMVLTDNMNLLGISEPYYLAPNYTLTIPNYFLNYDLVQSSPSFAIQNNTDLTMNLTPSIRSINYMYYTDTRHIDTTNYMYKLKTFDMNGIVNLKPTLSIVEDVSFQPIYYIVVTSANNNIGKNIDIVYSTKNTLQSTSTSTLYYSSVYPFYVPNKIVIVPTIEVTMYTISSYDKLYLEMGEIIIIDMNYFYVCGLNINNNMYVLKLIKHLGPILSYNCNGYYTLGSYLKKDNKKISDLPYRTITTYMTETTTDIGSYYITNNMMTLAMDNNVINNSYKFNEKPLTIKLYYMDGCLYLFDNFVKLKITDKLIYSTDIYNIVNIRDNIIYVDKDIANILNVSNSTFIEFTLPYQPFIPMFILFDESGNIMSTKLEDRMIICIDSNDITMNLYIVSNNSIDISMNAGYKWVRLLNTKYNSSYENSLYIPITTPSIQYNNMHPIEITTTYDIVSDRFKLMNSTDILKNFNFYYLQPIHYMGSFNYIKDISYDGTYYWFILITNSGLSASYDGKSVDIMFTPSYCNDLKYYTNSNFRFNSAIEMNDYDMVRFNIINVNQFTIYSNSDNLINIKTLVNSNNMINFYYGWEQENNETRNKIFPIPNYANIYFYNNRQLDINGFAQNSDTILGTYHLIAENVGDYNHLHLVKIIYPNKIKFYTSFQSANSSQKYYLDKVLPVNINILGEMTYTPPAIVVANNLLEINKNTIDMIKSYDINMIGQPQYIGGNNPMYKQQIQFNGISSFNVSLYNTIYLEDSLIKPYKITNENGNIYILSSTYLSNSIKTIYSNLRNYLQSAQFTNKTKKKVNIQDSSIDSYIDISGTTIEYFTFKILFSSYNVNGNMYKYRFINENYDTTATLNFNLNPNEVYNFNTNYSEKVLELNNIKRNIVLTYALDNTTLLNTNNYTDINIYIQHKIDGTENTELLQNVKQLRINLINSSVINSSDLFNYLKPWDNWSLLASINGDIKLVQLLNNCYLVWDNNSQSVVRVANIDPSYSYLTNNEVNRLTTFLQTIQNPTVYENYIKLKYEIEPIILNSMKQWLTNPQFFLHTTDNINKLLLGHGFDDCYFDGNNIIFYNDMNPTYYAGTNEVAYYITNEFEYNLVTNSVYRTTTSYNMITPQYIAWLTREDTNNFGVSINRLLQYIALLGTQMIELLNNFTNTFKTVDEDASLNSLAYLINRSWENHIDTNKNLTMLNKTEPTIAEYPYNITFKENVILPGSQYSVDFINGDNITKDLTIDSPTIYPDQLNFYSEYNIRPSDFILVKKQTNYSILSATYQGKLTTLSFDPSFNVNYVDTIYWRNNSLTIKSVDNNDIILYNPDTIDCSINDMYEVRNMLGIVSIVTNNSTQYIEFYSNNFNYIQGSTLMSTSTYTYMLNRDAIGWCVVGPAIDSYNVTIINTINPINITIEQQYAYNFDISGTMDSYYDMVPNNSIIPMDFQLIGNNIVYNPILVQSISSSNIQLIFSQQVVTKNASITNIMKVGTNFTNKVNMITKYPEYLYQFNQSIPSNYPNTTVYVYDVTQPDVIDPSDTSIHFKQNNNTTQFTINNNYSFIDIMTKCYIQKNTWVIDSTNYIVSNMFMSIVVPDNFILSTDTMYSYGVNDIKLDINTFVYSNGILSFQFNNDVSGSIVFTQIYNMTTPGMIIIPEQNQVVQYTLDYAWQYLDSEQYFITPLAIDGSQYKSNLYIIQTNQITSQVGFAEVAFGPEYTYTNKNITLYCNNIKYDGLIFDEYHDGSYIWLVVSVNNSMLPTNLSGWTYCLTDMITQNVLSIMDYMPTFQSAHYYKDGDNKNSVYMFVNTSQQNYSIIGNSPTSLQASKFYLVSYTDFSVTNMYSPNQFVMNSNMKRSIEYTYNTNTTTVTPQFNNYSKFFSYIRFYINDMMIEELNEDTMNLDYFLYMTDENRRQFDNIVKIRTTVNGWELTIPLKFWFNNKSGKAIPTVALPYSELRLEYKLNNLEYTLSNDMSGSYILSNDPTPKLYLYSEYVVLDNMERKLFGSYGHEYVIDRYKTYLPNNIYNKQTTITKKWNGLVKDIYFISKPNDYAGLTYFPKITNSYDAKYARYTKSKIYYNQYMVTKIYTPESKPYSDDIMIIYNNNIELANYITAGDKSDNSKYARINNLIATYSMWSIWDSQYELLRYLMYYEDKYLFLLTNNVARTNYILTQYLTYIYRNKNTVQKIQPVTNMLIRTNGTELFSKRDSNYYTNVIPIQKFNNSLPEGFYCYSFSLNPCEEQWSGHMNFTNIEDVNIVVESETSYGPYQLNCVLKEYNILRIMSGMGSLAWVD
jgi:hypothetical protein